MKENNSTPDTPNYKRRARTYSKDREAKMIGKKDLEGRPVKQRDTIAAQSKAVNGHMDHRDL